MPQEKKKHISTTTGLLIILAAAVIIGGGAIAYFYAQSPTFWDYMGNRTSVHKSSSNANTNTANTNSTTNESSNNVYTNSKFGFSFTLPSDYTALEEYNCEGSCGVTLQIGKKSGTRVSDNTYITINYNQASQTLAELKKGYESGNNDIIKTADIKIDTQDAVKYDIGGMSGGFHFLAAKGKFNLQINAYPYEASNSLLDNTISSFKFGSTEFK